MVKSNWWYSVVFLEIWAIATLISYFIEPYGFLTRLLLVLTVFFILLVLLLHVKINRLPKKSKKEIKTKQLIVDYVHQGFSLKNIKSALKKQKINSKIANKILHELQHTKTLNSKFKRVLKNHNHKN